MLVFAYRLPNRVTSDSAVRDFGEAPVDSVYDMPMIFAAWGNAAIIPDKNFGAAAVGIRPYAAGHVFSNVDQLGV